MPLGDFSFQKRSDLNRCELQVELTHLRPRQQQQVIYQAAQLDRLLEDSAQSFLEVAFRCRLKTQRDLCLAADNGQRGAQLVGHIGDELTPT